MDFKYILYAVYLPEYESGSIEELRRFDSPTGAVIAKEQLYKDGKYGYEYFVDVEEKDPGS